MGSECSLSLVSHIRRDIHTRKLRLETRPTCVDAHTCKTKDELYDPKLHLLPEDSLEVLEPPVELRPLLLFVHGDVPSIVSKMEMVPFSALFAEEIVHQKPHIDPR